MHPGKAVCRALFVVSPQKLPVTHLRRGFLCIEEESLFLFNQENSIWRGVGELCHLLKELFLILDIGFCGTAEDQRRIDVFLVDVEEELTHIAERVIRLAEKMEPGSLVYGSVGIIFFFFISTLLG